MRSGVADANPYDGVDAGDVSVRITPDLQLEAGVTLGAIARDFGRHFVRRLLGNRPVEPDAFAVAPAHEHTDRQAGGLPEDIPAGDVDTGFHIRMALQGGIHAMVEFDEFAGVLTDEVRAEFAEAGADAFGIGGKIEWSEGTDFEIGRAHV